MNESMETAQAAYEVYCKVMPATPLRWENLPAHVQTGWRVATRFAENVGNCNAVKAMEADADDEEAMFADLDKGIEYAVRVLRSVGIETYESCQGGAGHSYAEPTVRFFGDHSEGFRALAVALQHALPVRALNRTWAVIDGEPTGPEWELVFWKPVPMPPPVDAADDFDGEPKPWTPQALTAFLGSAQGRRIHAEMFDAAQRRKPAFIDPRMFPGTDEEQVAQYWEEVRQAAGGENGAPYAKGTDTETIGMIRQITTLARLLSYRPLDNPAVSEALDDLITDPRVQALRLCSSPSREQLEPPQSPRRSPPEPPSPPGTNPWRSR